MRSTAGASGEILELDAPGTQIDGCWSWNASDPRGNGDDGGTVIADGSGGWWGRQNADTGNTVNISADKPIQLNWYQLSNNDNITTLLGDLATAYTPALYVQMPTTATAASITLELGTAAGTLPVNRPAHTLATSFRNS